MNGTFEHKVGMSTSEFEKWEKATAGQGVYVVELEDDIKGIYLSGRPPKHIGTYMADEEALFCDDIGLFGHFIESTTLKGTRLQEDDTAADDQQQDDGGDQAGDEGGQEEAENPVAAEVDGQVGSDDQVELNNDIQQEGNPMKMPTSAPIPNGVPTSPEGDPMALADGTDTQVAQDSSLQYDAINPEGQASISFKNGNFNQMAQMPQQINTKIATIQKTIMPLAEVALIELLGNNKAFVGEDFNAVFNMLDGQPKFECHATYGVELFIGTDIAQEDIQHDAKYILDRLSAVPNVQWNECSIDCTDGKVHLGFII